jgi:AbrB family looped-hinge helix DNA binding protein
MGRLILSGNDTLCGNVMSEATSKIDAKGRVMIPKSVRREVKLKTGTCVSIKAKNTTIIIEPAESIAEKHCGIFQIIRWPEDLDEFVVEAYASRIRQLID